MTISILRDEAVAAALPALSEILRDCVANGASVGFMAKNSAADYAAYWDAVAADARAGRVTLFVAETEDGIVGTAQLQVLVHSKARRQGLGEALMRAAEQEAIRLSRDLLVLDTDEKGAARRLYHRLGWTEVGTIPRYALMPDGSDCGSTFFDKDLRAAVQFASAART